MSNVRSHLNALDPRLTFTPDVEALAELRSAWAWLLAEPYTPLLFSILGDAFVQVESGAVVWLNTGTGELEHVAGSAEEFERLLLSSEAQDWFLPSLVERLHEAGKVPKPGQCFSYVTLPVFREGKYEVSNLNPVPAREHFGLTGLVHSQLQGLADGAKVRVKVVP